jgi:NTE family protein
MSEPSDPDRVGLVLAGGGARGAYEIGALAELLPHLPAAEQPRIILGTSVGALNAAYLAATAGVPVEKRLADAEQLWRGIRYDDVLEPLFSPSAIGRLGRYAGQFLGLHSKPLESVLDPKPLATTLGRIPIGDIAANIGATLDTAAVAATSGATNLSVVFHEGGTTPPRDAERGIDYVRTRLETEHVLASSAIPVLFPAVEVAGPGAGWYFDGGTRLNTPIKPALELGAQRLIVIALNSPTSRTAPGTSRRPDALDAAGQFVQAVLVDPLVGDVHTLATINRMLIDDDERAARTGKRVVPYILIAPPDPDAIGRCASAVYREHYGRLRDLLRLRSLALLGRFVDAGASAEHGELLSYVLFAEPFIEAVLDMGRRDARRWIDAHPGDLWER